MIARFSSLLRVLLLLVAAQLVFACSEAQPEQGPVVLAASSLLLTAIGPFAAGAALRGLRE